MLRRWRGGGNRDADTAAIESGALLVRRLSTDQEAVVALGIKAVGHFGSRTAPECLRLFAVAPSTLVAASTAARTAGFAALAKALASSASPATSRRASGLRKLPR
jgi:hypothetical protein